MGVLREASGGVPGFGPSDPFPFDLAPVPACPPAMCVASGTTGPSRGRWGSDHPNPITDPRSLPSLTS
jgi:hypothetical protein